MIMENTASIRLIINVQAAFNVYDIVIESLILQASLYLCKKKCLNSGDFEDLFSA